MATAVVRRSTYLAPTLVVRGTAAGSLVGAALVHATQALPHAREWVVGGGFFIVVAALQLVLGVALATSDERRYRNLAFVVTFGTLGVWGFSRIIGLPFGPYAGELAPVARPDVLANGLELLTIGALLAPRSGRRFGRSTAAALAVIAAVGAFGVATALPVHRHVERVVHESEGMRPIDYLRAHGEHRHGEAEPASSLP